MGKVLDFGMLPREGLFQEPKCHKERKKEGTERDVIYVDNRKLKAMGNKSRRPE